MLVCHCYCVSDKTIRKCIRDGAKTLDEIRAATMACMNCQSCADTILDIIDEEGLTNKPED